MIPTLVSVCLFLSCLSAGVIVGFLRADYRRGQELQALKSELIETQARLECQGRVPYQACLKRAIARRYELPRKGNGG